MANWEVPPHILTPYIPKGTELDLWEGRALISLVGFKFLNTRVLGAKIPYHVNFDEINVRFYVIRRVGGEVRRGVVFIKEIVPRFWIAFIARTLFNERYICGATSHDEIQNGEGRKLEYVWKINKERYCLGVDAHSEFVSIAYGSLPEFIAEHYWGYSVGRSGEVLEYRVSHPRWMYQEISAFEIKGNFQPLYGSEISTAMERPPLSVYLFNGSGVEVGFGKRISL